MKRWLVRNATVHTDLVEFNDEGLGALLAQQGLGGLAVGAVRLGKDGCSSRTLDNHG
jgi:hypothetical protein